MLKKHTYIHIRPAPVCYPNTCRRNRRNPQIPRSALGPDVHLGMWHSTRSIPEALLLPSWVSWWLDSVFSSCLSSFFSCLSCFFSCLSSFFLCLSSFFSCLSSFFSSLFWLVTSPALTPPLHLDVLCLAHVECRRKVYKTALEKMQFSPR